jgi:hypothetical protein
MNAQAILFIRTFFAVHLRTDLKVLWACCVNAWLVFCIFVFL